MADSVPMSFSLPAIPALGDAALALDLQHTLDSQLPHTGGLGRLGELAVQLGMLQGTLQPGLDGPQWLLLAGDHGLASHAELADAEDGPLPAWVQAQAGGAALAWLAQQHGLPFTLVDCGLRQPLQDGPAGLEVQPARVGAGTADALGQPAMTVEQCHIALGQGQQLVRARPGKVLLLGACGHGSLASAALLQARLLGADIGGCLVARGQTPQALEARQGVLVKILQRHAFAAGPLAAITAFGGFEIATLVGCLLRAAHERRLVVLDGPVALVAALAARALSPHVLQACVVAQDSEEPAHSMLLQALGLQPLMDLGLHLHAATGAAMVWPLLQAAVASLQGWAVRAPSR